MTIALKILEPAEEGKSKTLMLDRRLTRPATEAVADALEAACVVGLSLGSSDMPNHLTE